MMETRRRADPAALRPGARRLGATPAATRPRRSGTCCTTAALGVAVRTRAVPRASARSPAASRSGWCSRRCCAGPTRCCCSTSPTTTSTSRASAGSRSGCARRPRRCCSSRHDRELLARAARPDRHPRARRGRRHRLDARRRLRHLPPGARRPERAARGAAPPLGRGARQAQGARPHVQDEGGLQRRHGLALPGGARPGCAGSRRPGRRRSTPQRAERDDAAARRAHGQARGGLRGRSSSPA